MMYQTIFKTILVILAGSALFFSCGGGEPESKSTSEEKSEVAAPSKNKPEASGSGLYPEGEEVYKQTCQACHQANGEGIPNAFPPLANSDYLVADKKRAIEQIIKGSSGEIVVNGQKYTGSMPPQNLTDEQISDVLNFALNSWGNNGGNVTVDEVKQLRGNNSAVN